MPTKKLNKGIVFCFTGKCPKPRPEMEKMAIEAGASVTRSITSRTSVLVLADIHSQSSKAKNARMAGIDLITPKTFFTLCYGLSAAIVPQPATPKTKPSINKTKTKTKKKNVAVVSEKPRRRIILD